MRKGHLINWCPYFTIQDLSCIRGLTGRFPSQDPANLQAHQKDTPLQILLLPKGFCPLPDLRQLHSKAYSLSHAYLGFQCVLHKTKLSSQPAIKNHWHHSGSVRLLTKHWNNNFPQSFLPHITYLFLT